LHGSSASPEEQVVTVRRAGSSGFSAYSSGDEEALFAMEGGNGRRKGSDAEATPGTPLPAQQSSRFGRAANIGNRKTMEDFDVAVPECEDAPLGLYGVFDGHCGTRVSQLASERLHGYCREHASWPHDPVAAVDAALQRIEVEFLEMAARESFPDGSCALVALVRYPYPGAERATGVALANIGDSRAVLYDAGVVHSSVEHSPARADERARIEALGGWVTIETEMHVDRLRHMDLSDPRIREAALKSFNYITVSRVNGELAVSRALGDPDYKRPAQDAYPWFFPEGHPGKGNKEFVFENDLVDSTPEWLEFTLSSEHMARAFLIVACDGLWETMSSDEAVRIARSCRSAQEASDVLVDMALRMGSTDNVTVLVVQLAPDSFAPQGFLFPPSL
jgi:serine/threonine protein phosphatase PrpC